MNAETEPQKWTAAKFWVAFAYALGISALQIGILHGTVLHWVTIVVALLGAVTVYVWPNKPVESGAKDNVTVINP